jgi:hypothetical protein
VEGKSYFRVARGIDKGAEKNHFKYKELGIYRCCLIEGKCTKNIRLSNKFLLVWVGFFLQGRGKK